MLQKPRMESNRCYVPGTAEVGHFSVERQLQSETIWAARATYGSRSMDKRHVWGFPLLFLPSETNNYDWLSSSKLSNYRLL